MKRCVNLRKIFISTILFTLLLIALSLSIQAVEYSGTCGDNLTWSLNTDTGIMTISGTGSMTDYTGTSQPWVTTRSSIKIVNINNGVTSIGAYAFYQCTVLANVTIPASVTSIGSCAFHSCTSLTSVTIPNSVTTIGVNAFYDCTGLTSVTIPNSVTSIGIRAFYGCIGLTNISLPNSITTIGDYTFYSCKSLTSITIPDSVTSIGNNAFSYCTGLTSITIPNSVTSVGGSAFLGCTGLTSVTLPNNLMYIGGYTFYDCRSLTNIILPNSITTIGDYTFYGCKSLTSITIPDSVTIIGERAFYGCTGLTSVNIPDGVTNIGSDMFNGCRSLTSITIPDSVTDIGTRAFYSCTGLTIITIPDSVKIIGPLAFYNCTGLTSITLSDSITSIKERAFFNCTGLTNVTIPGNITQIHGLTFASCTGMTSAFFYGDVPSSFGGNVFSNTATNFKIYYIEGKSGWTTPTWTSPGPAVYNTAIFTGEIINDNNDGVYDRQTYRTNITVYQNKYGSESISDKYVLSSGAAVVYNGAEYLTGNDGRVMIPAIIADSVTFSKAGYITQMVTAERIIKSPNIYLQKVSGKPVINAVWVNNTNVLTDEYEIGLLSNDSVTITAEVSWGSGTADRIILNQKAKSVSFTGTTLTTVLSDNFDVSETIYIIAYDAEGNDTKKALKFEEDGGVPESLNGFDLNIGDSIDLTIPDNIPLFGGTELSLDLAAKMFPMSIVVEGKKVYVTVGVDIVSYTKESPVGKTKKQATKILFQNIKSWKETLDDAQKSFKKLQNIKQTYKDAFKSREGSFGFDADISVLGFAEGYIDSGGKFILINSGVIVNPSINYKISKQEFIYAVPVYWEVAIKAAVEAQFNLKTNPEAKEFTSDGIFDGTLTVSGDGGLGLNKIVTVGVGLEGELSPYWEINSDDTDYFKLTASVNAYFKANLVCFTYIKKSDKLTGVWIEYPDPATVNETSSLSAENEITFTDTEQYTLQDRSYLNNTSEYMPERLSASISAGAISGVSETVFMSNTYTETDPQLISFGNGTKLMVWLADDPARSDINRLSLSYSYYNGSAWSNPAWVSADGTIDYMPSLRVINGTAYLTWQNASMVFDDTADLDGIAPYFDISAAVYDAASNTFAVTTLSNENLDMMPVVCGDESGIAIVWLNNGENAWFGENSSNSVMTSSFDGSAWSVPQVLYSGINSVSSLAADLSGGILYTAYSTDGDNDLSNSDDTEVYLNGVRITENTVIDSGVVFQNQILYWNRGSGIVALSNMAEPSSAAALSVNISGSNFQISDNDTTKAILYTESKGLYSTLYAIFYDRLSGAWGEPVALTGGSAYISDYSAVISDTGGLQIIMNKISVTGSFSDENPYGQTDLILADVAFDCNLTAGYIYCSEQNLIPGNTVTLYTEITNSGKKTVRSYLTEVIDSTGTVLSSALFNTPLLPGQKTEAEAYYTVGDPFAAQTVTVRVTPVGDSDIDTGDNSADLLLRYIDIAVEKAAWGTAEDGQTYIYGNIVNRGYTTETDLTVELRTDTANGAVINSQVIDSLDSLSLSGFSFTDTYEKGKAYYITVVGCEEDMMKGNDSAFVFIEKAADIIFDFKGVAIKLIEPWGLRFYTLTSGEDFNSSLSFGTIVLHQKYYTAGMTSEEMMASPNAIVLTSESGDSVLDSSSRIVGTMVGGIYTYTMNTSFYTAAYVIINGETIFSPVDSRNIYDRVVYLKDNSTDIYVKPIYQEMYNLYTDVKSYHDSLGTVTIPEPETIKRGSECSPGTVAANTGLVAYSFKGVAIRLIEPWGLCFYTEMIVPDMNSVAEFGTVVLSEDDYQIGMTGEELRLSDNSYVFNSADGTAVYDSSKRIVAKLVDSIYTYNMDTVFYTVSYAVIGGEYYYSDVNCRNMYDRVSLLKDTSSNVYVKEIYASMYSLYSAVDSYHRSLGLK